MIPFRIVTASLLLCGSAFADIVPDPRWRQPRPANSPEADIPTPEPEGFADDPTLMWVIGGAALVVILFVVLRRRRRVDG